MAPQETCPQTTTSSSIQSYVHFLFLVISGLFCACAWASPQGDHGLQEMISKAALEKNLKNDHQSQLFGDADHLQLEEGDSQESCYPAVFSRNMSSLLTEAFNMLDRVQDTRERSWLKSFIQRLSYLADDLQKHPGIKRPECIQLLTSPSSVSEQVTNQNPVRSSLTHEISYRSKSTDPVESYSSTKPSIGPEADDLEQQLRSGPSSVTTFEPKPFREQPHGMIDVRVWTPAIQSGEESRSIAPDAAPDANRQKLLGEISSQVHRLRELGLTERDILSIWKQSDSTIDPKGISTSGLRPDELDFDDEEQGAALGELDPSWTNTAAPSLIDVESTAAGPLPVTSPRDQDDVDDLVQQLQSQKFVSSAGKPTRSRVRFQAPSPH